MQNLRTKTVKGIEYWVARVQRDGKVCERSLGCTARIKKAEAQKRLLQFLIEVESGEIKRRTKSHTFNDLWPEALKSIAEVKRWKSPKTEESWRYSFSHYAARAFGKKQVKDITREDVLGALTPLWTTKTETAGKLRMRLEAFFSWAEVNGHRTASNPALWKGNLEYFLPPLSKVRPVKHHEAPTIEELREAVRYCLAHPSPASGLVLFLIATGVRVSEARLAKPAEIEGDTWIMPAKRRKDKKPEPMRVPLSTLAKKALAMQSAGKFLFSTSGKKPLAIDTPRLKLRMMVEKKNEREAKENKAKGLKTGEQKESEKRLVTMHGARSTFRDWAAINGIDYVASEKVLSHTVGSTVTQAYLREDMLEARRPIMQQWADLLMA